MAIGSNPSEDDREEDVKQLLKEGLQLPLTYSFDQVAESFDPVEKPSHYNWLPGIECNHVTRWFNFNLGNVIKYVWRAGKKHSASKRQDLEKAIKYLRMELEWLDEMESSSDS